MALREWAAWLPPPRSLVTLVLAAVGFGLRLAACHVTHSPTLEVDTCHALCRLLGLLTTVIAFKFERADVGREHETQLRNTFGWARIEVVGRLATHVLFASFALSLVVASIQTAVHSSHAEPPCDPFPALTIGVALGGLLLHIIGYGLLAGQELSYGRRLSVTESGGVVLKTGGRVEVLAHAPADIISCLFVVSAGLVSAFGEPCKHHPHEHADSHLFTQGMLLRMADPALSAVASIVLVACNYPFLREAGMVLLETVPEGLGTAGLLSAAEGVPGVLAIHELHVWQLYPRHVVATAHVCYRSHLDYLKNSGLVAEVFTKHGISLVTLQPEFASETDSPSPAAACESEQSLRLRLRQSCARPCVSHCTAPRCCGPPGPPALPSTPVAL